MRASKNLYVSILLVCILGSAASAQTGQAGRQTPPQTGVSGATVKTVDEAVDRIIARERDEVTTIERFRPVVETYIQDMKPDPNMGNVPAGDHYLLGQADLSNGVVDHSLLAPKKGGALDALNPIAHLGSVFTSSTSPEVFLRMIFVDTKGFDRGSYQFEYVRREFLGEVRCVVFDVTPLPGSGKGRFTGRIWAEDQNFTIVRFNGMDTPIAEKNGFNLHFDSWRLNVQPNLWVPAYIFSQDSGHEHTLGGVIRFRAQTRLWGYNLKNSGGHEEFTAVTVTPAPGSSGQLLDPESQAKQGSPIDAEREWRRQAENNVLNSLERAGLLAPRGPADKTLEIVVNNLEVTNNLDIQPEVQCRVLLTGTLEMFSIGHSIVLSRGLIDVLPDEASLATMLAQELADILLTKPSTDQWGFNDTTKVSAVDALSRFTFKDSPAQIQEANQKALELLKNSPYKDKLASAGLFLKQLDADSKALPALINPRLGNGIFLANQLMSLAPNLDPTKLEQISALPIGARVKVDPWTDQVELINAKPVRLISAREKLPFEITPFAPYLTRYSGTRTDATQK
jgi:hypothetical protein